MARDRYIHVRMNGNEKQLISTTAQLLHLTEASWMRMVLLREAERVIAKYEKEDQS